MFVPQAVMAIVSSLLGPSLTRRLGARAVGWPANEVAAINEARIAGWSDAKIRALVAELVAQRTAGGAR